MPITLNELTTFEGWTLMIFSAENGQRFAGKICSVKQHGKEELPNVIIFVDWMITDDMDQNWRPAISADTGQPITCWSGQFSRAEEITPGEDGNFCINHYPAQQIIFFYPPGSEFAKKCQKARNHITKLQQRV